MMASRGAGTKATVECVDGGPIDGKLLPDIGICLKVSEPDPEDDTRLFIHHYHQCNNGHYHYHGSTSVPRYDHDH